jgi:hypothetical protein
MNITTGALFGILVIFFYLLTILNYLVKLINRKYGKRMRSHEKGYRIYTGFMKFIIKNHRLFGAAALLFLIIHVIIQYNAYQYLNQTGAAAASVLLLQVILGIYGSKKGMGKTRKWLYYHRTVAVLLPVVIAVHVF